jgi:hypothetical protein
MVLICTFSFFPSVYFFDNRFLHMSHRMNSTALMEHKFTGNIPRINESFSYSRKALPCQVDQKLILLFKSLQRFNSVGCNHTSSNLCDTSNLQRFATHHSLQPIRTAPAAPAVIWHNGQVTQKQEIKFADQHKSSEYEVMLF